MKHLATVAALAATALTPAAAAQAKATDTGRHTVAKQVYVYERAGVGFTGTAFKGWTFDVQRLSPSGKWAYGMAYGHINRHAWISAAALKAKR